MPTGIYIRTKPSSKKGKTFEELYGEKFANDIKMRMGEKRRKRAITAETREKLRIAMLGNKNGINANVGKRYSLQHRKNISRAKKGKKFSFEHRKNLSLARIGKMSGIDSSNWKGGITPKNKRARVKFQQTIQKQVFERDNYTCQICGQRGGYLQVDHIQPWKEYIKLRFSIDNCRTLCMKCHYKITFGREMPKGLVWGHNLSKLKNNVDNI